MITPIRFASPGVLTALLLLCPVAAHGQLIQDLSDLDPTNPDSGINEGISDLSAGLPRVDSPVLRADDPTYISDPTDPVASSARFRQIKSSESGLWLVPIREEKSMNFGRVCLYRQNAGGFRDQNWRFVPTPFGFRIVNADSGLSLVPVREDVRKNFGRVCLYNVQGPGVRDQSWQNVRTRHGVRIVSAESGLSLVPIREQVHSNFGRLCLYNVVGDGVRDQNWLIGN